ncbi:unnamed protein product [Hymenolepis diminuta]|uniref:FHA domain-containing protein n=1 Tax=Hymenolepis diminuta TaxID=6216 RepID=A0A564YIF8_HYMDI|nr:unnamed protein product [Hymenolepis diminuta]
MAPRGHIVILKRDGTSGSSCEWHADKCVFGSESSCDVCIKLKSVDPFHCKLENSDDGRVFIINVAKSPRTLLNGSGVFERTFVAHNSLITVGDRNFKFQYPEDSQWRLHPAGSSLSRSAKSPLVLSSSRLVADVSQLPAVKSGSPRRPQLQTPRPRTPTLSSQRSGLSTRDRYGPTPTRPAALSPDVSVKRRSILKKRSPSLEVLASPVQKKAKVFVLSETPFLTGTQYIKRLRRSSSLDASVHSNNSASFYSANASPNQSRTYFAKSSPSYVQKKGVQFGPRLSPEQFDSRLPPATPLKRGDLPPSDLNTRSRHSVVKKTPGFVPSPVLVLKSPVVKGTHVLNTQKSLRSPNLPRIPRCRLSSEVATPELSVRKILKTPVAVPSPGLSAVRELVKSPKSPSPARVSTKALSPKLSVLRNLVKTPELQPSPKLSGIQVLLKTPKQLPYPRPSAARRTVSTPKSPPTPRLSGVRQLVKTPKSKLPLELVGVRDLLKTPKALPPPRLSAVRTILKAPGIQPSPKLAGVRDTLKTPRSQLSPSLSGVRKLMKTPKNQKSPRLVGVRELFKTPKLLPSPRLSGVRKLMKTPKNQRSPRLTGLREILKTPKKLPSPRLSGVRRLLKTPQSFSSGLVGMQELVRTPKIRSSPRLSGVRELMSTPKSLSSLGLSRIGKSIQIPKSTDARKSPRTSKLQQSPRLAGIREMVRTPKSIPSPRLSGIKEIMVDLTGERTRVTTFPKPATPKTRPAGRGGTRITRNKTANVTPIRTTRGRGNASRPVVKSTSKKNTVKKVGNQMVTVAAGKSHATVRPRGRGRNALSVPEVAIDLEEEKGHVEPVSSKLKTGRSQRRVVKKATEIVAFAEPEVRSTRRKRNLSPSPPSISFDPEGAAAPSKRARATRGRAEAKKLTEAKVGDSVTVKVRSSRKRRISYSSGEITIDLEEGENAEPTSPKRIRTVGGRAAEKKTRTQTAQTTTLRINKAEIASPAKKSEVSTLVRKSGSRKRTTRAAKGTVEKPKEAEVVAPSTLVGKTASKKRTTTKASTIKKSVKKASPVAAKFGRATRKVHFRKSVSEITRREELMSLQTPVRRTRGKTTGTKSSVAKSPEVTSLTRPVPRTRSKK